MFGVSYSIICWFHGYFESLGGTYLNRGNKRKTNKGGLRPVHAYHTQMHIVCIDKVGIQRLHMADDLEARQTIHVTFQEDEPFIGNNSGGPMAAEYFGETLKCLGFIWRFFPSSCSERRCGMREKTVGTNVGSTRIWRLRKLGLSPMCLAEKYQETRLQETGNWTHVFWHPRKLGTGWEG